MKDAVVPIKTVYTNLLVRRSCLCVLSSTQLAPCTAMLTYTHDSFILGVPREFGQPQTFFLSQLCTVISFWCEMSSSVLSPLCLKSISSHLEFTVNNNQSTTVFLLFICAEISREKQLLNASAAVRPRRRVAGAWCFQPVSLSETLVYLKSFIQTCAGKLRARCGPQLNPRRDTPKCKMAVATK